MNRATISAAVLLVAGSALAVAADDGLLEAAGRGLFKRNWVPAPASTASTDGLGPLFNARSCTGCHAGAGRGRLDVTNDGAASGGFVVRLARPDGSPDPIYGAQIQTSAVPGLKPEARVRIDWQWHDERLDDGTVAALRRPNVILENLAYGPLDPSTVAGLRLAPDLRAASRIAAVDEERLARAAASGRANEPRMLFGLKQTEPSIAHQAALAFSRDLGMSTTAFPPAAGDCTSHQGACLEAPQGAYGGETEITPEALAAVVAYLEGLEARSRPALVEGEAGSDGARLFAATGCASCHTPSQPAHDGRPIALYSDLDRHDLGADMADPAPTRDRKASEWRTAPLLGVGQALADGRPLLHDGRARSVSEAVLWHGGDAAVSVKSYKTLPASERQALDDYVQTR